jgi:hypothetical protein
MCFQFYWKGYFHYYWKLKIKKNVYTYMIVCLKTQNTGLNWYKHPYGHEIPWSTGLACAKTVTSNIFNHLTGTSKSCNTNINQMRVLYRVKSLHLHTYDPVPTDTWVQLFVCGKVYLIQPPMIKMLVAYGKVTGYIHR